MSYKLKRDETVVEGVRRAALDQVEKAIDEAGGGDRREAVHAARKRCKKVRGLIRLFRPAFEDTYQRENARFRDAARELSDLRDATGMIECVDGLLKRYGDGAAERLERVRAALDERREQVEGEQDVEERLEAFARSMEDAKGAIETWELEEAGFEAIGPGLAKTYGRARKAMRGAAREPSGERYHEWRKRVKYHGQHCKLLREVWSPLMMDRRDEAKRLSDLLGDGHDLDVLRGVITREPGRFGGEGGVADALGLIDARRAELRAWAGPAGERLFAEKTKRFAKRVGAMHCAWIQEGTLRAALAEESGRALT